MSDKSYKSTGTIRGRFGATMNPAKSGKKGHKPPTQLTKKIFFTPSTDFTVPRGGKPHAVFIPVEKARGRLRTKRLPESGEGVSIKVKSDLPCLVEAATRQTLVEVEVKKHRSGWTLCTITVPAPDKQK